MSAQTTYTANPIAGLPGMPYDINHGNVAWSGAYGNATPCDVGDYLCRLAADATTFELPDAAGDVTTAFGGFVMYQPHRVSSQIARYEEVALFRRGLIWLYCVDGITADAPGYVRRDGTNNGKIYSGSTGASLLPGIRCIIGCAALGTALFHVDLG